MNPIAEADFWLDYVNKGCSLYGVSEFLKMFNRGFSKNQISRDLQVAPRTVRTVIRHFQRYVTLSTFSYGGSEPHKVKDDALLQNKYGYQVQYSNNQSIIALLKR